MVSVARTGSGNEFPIWIRIQDSQNADLRRFRSISMSGLSILL